MIYNYVNPVNFTGKYQINANQAMPDKEACLKRDFVTGYWIHEAKNGQELQAKFEEFIASDYEKNKTTPCNLVFDLNDKDDSNFEESMKMVGQKFDKLV